MTGELKNLKLYYFAQVFGSKTLGRGENIRLLFEDAGLDYEFVGCTVEEWRERKEEFDRQGYRGLSMPYISINDTYYFKTVPIMRYVCKKLGKYLGEDEEEEHVLDVCADFVTDWLSQWVDSLFTKHEDVVKTFKESYNATAVVTIEKILSDRDGPYVLGNKITYIDFLLYHTLEDTTPDDIDPKVYPHITKLKDAIRNRPNVKKYLDSL